MSGQKGRYQIEHRAYDKMLATSVHFDGGKWVYGIEWEQECGEMWRICSSETCMVSPELNPALLGGNPSSTHLSYGTVKTNSLTHSLTHSLTNTMKQSPSWEAKRHSATQ